MWVASQSKTESLISTESAFMEFDVMQEEGYAQFRGMLVELGGESCLFNGYLIQTEPDEVSISTSAVQLHCLRDSVYLAKPFEQEHYYDKIFRSSLRVAKVYFVPPPYLTHSFLEGYKPKLDEISAIDIWVVKEYRQVIYSFLYEASIRTTEKMYHFTRFAI